VEILSDDRRGQKWRCIGAPAGPKVENTKQLERKILKSSFTGDGVEK